MSRHLRPDQIEAIADLIIRVQDDFRLTHGLEPLSSPWRKLEGPVLGRLANLGTLADLAGSPIPRSHRRGVGKIIETTRRIVWKVLQPILDRQTAFNRELLVIVDDMARDRARLERTIVHLVARLAEADSSTNGRPRE